MLKEPGVGWREEYEKTKGQVGSTCSSLEKEERKQKEQN